VITDPVCMVDQGIEARPRNGPRRRRRLGSARLPALGSPRAQAGTIHRRRCPALRPPVSEAISVLHLLNGFALLIVLTGNRTYNNGFGHVGPRRRPGRDRLDMTRFPTAGRLTSWSKLCPRTIQSGPDAQPANTPNTLVRYILLSGQLPVLW
jgi:hypothetical protein